MICEMCQSNDLIKQDGVYVCRYCGTKYSVEEAKKLLGTVKIDKTEENQKLLVLARRARDEGNSQNAEKYYGMVLQEAPDNWEAAFFHVYFQAMQSTVGNINYSARSLGNCLESVAGILSKADKREQISAIKTIVVPCMKISELFATSAVNHYDKHMTVDGTFTECVNNLVSVSLILGKLEVIVKHFGDDKNVLVSVQKYYVNYLNTYKKFFNKDFLYETITRLSSEIKMYDSSFTAPTVNTGGCYVATAVYGSYDCPEVWTLRRFRDFTLDATWYGRVFIKCYYATSPTLVKWFGDKNWFRAFWKKNLDAMVSKLISKGFDNTSYIDKY